jgi:hypothetical protein
MDRTRRDEDIQYLRPFFYLLFIFFLSSPLSKISLRASCRPGICHRAKSLSRQAFDEEKWQLVFLSDPALTQHRSR